MERRRSTLGLFALCALGAALAACASSGGASRAETPADVARMKMAGELVSRGDWPEAFALLNELHQQRPQDPQVLVWRGIVYRERGLLTDAETDLRAALKVAPESSDAHAALGILFDIQMRPGAEAEHREAVRLAPNNPAYLNNLGFSLFLREHFKEAIGEYEKAARLAPLSPRVRTNMGFAYAALGDLPKAAREFRMGGNEADATNNLGFAYERRGDLANAYDLYLQAVRIDPTAVRARSNLVHAALVLGRTLPADAAAPAAPASSSSPSSPTSSPSPSPSPSVSSSSVSPSLAPASAASLSSTPGLAKQPVATP